MRIIVTGGRNYTDRATIGRVLAGYRDQAPTLIHGACRTGVDEWADFLARYVLEWRVEPYPADWRLGRRAGPLRNQAMVDSGADLVIAFPGGRGTADCVRRAKAAGIPVREIQP